MASSWSRRETSSSRTRRHFNKNCCNPKQVRELGEYFVRLFNSNQFLMVLCILPCFQFSDSSQTQFRGWSGGPASPHLKDLLMRIDFLNKPCSRTLRCSFDWWTPAQSGINQRWRATVNFLFISMFVVCLFKGGLTMYTRQRPAEASQINWMCPSNKALMTSTM